MPRNLTHGETNWPDCPSATDRIYLTDAYAIYFAAACADDDERGLIVEVDVDPHDLRPDEDFIAQCRPPQTRHMTPNDASQYWLQRVGAMTNDLGTESLKSLGTCAVFKSPLRPTRLIEFETRSSFIVSDPAISILNYQVCGSGYRDSLRRFVETDGRELWSPFGQVAIIDGEIVRQGGDDIARACGFDITQQKGGAA